MTRTIRTWFGVAACSCLLAAAGAAADKPATATKTKETKTEKAVRNAWQPETISGKIMMVDTAKKLLVVKGPGGVPYDLRVTPSTKIESGKQKLKLKDLNADLKKNISVRFVPERAGDIARSIELT